MAGGLLPVPFQIFRRIGMLIWLLPVPAFVGFLMSLRFVLFRSFQGVCIVAISMFVCASLYAAYCSFLLYFVLGVRAA